MSPSLSAFRAPPAPSHAPLDDNAFPPAPLALISQLHATIWGSLLISSISLTYLGGETKPRIGALSGEVAEAGRV